jgi:hypothetical protein
MTLEQVEKLVKQLSPTQQLKLVARICEQLSAAPNIEPTEDEDPSKQKRLQLAEELLSEVDYIEDDSKGEFDAAADLRQLREERIKQICQSDA